MSVCVCVGQWLKFSCLKKICTFCTYVPVRGVPIITGTNMKVIELVLEKAAYGWSPEEHHFQHPHLSLGQIHSALAYYWDHQKELDADIEKRLATVEKIQQKMDPPNF